MGHSQFDPAIRRRRPRGAGRVVGAKRALKPQQVCAIGFWLDRERRICGRALFDRAIDSKLHSATRAFIHPADLATRVHSAPSGSQ